MGGIAAQEVIKKTGKYLPINQYLWFDFFETIEFLNGNINRDIFGSRNDDQISIYGQKIQKKLNDLNVFIIGAGALGCELLKNFSLMGISVNNKAKTIITDNDLIELSNLNRQFLFRDKDIGQSKSKISSEKARLANKKFNCHCLEMFVNNEIGAKQDLAKIGKAIKEKNNNTIFHVDAVQGFGKYEIKE